MEILHGHKIFAVGLCFYAATSFQRELSLTLQAWPCFGLCSEAQLPLGSSFAVHHSCAQHCRRDREKAPYARVEILDWGRCFGLKLMRCLLLGWVPSGYACRVTWLQGICTVSQGLPGYQRWSDTCLGPLEATSKTTSQWVRTLAETCYTRRLHLAVPWAAACWLPPGGTQKSPDPIDFLGEKLSK